MIPTKDSPTFPCLHATVTPASVLLFWGIMAHQSPFSATRREIEQCGTCFLEVMFAADENGFEGAARLVELLSIHPPVNDEVLRLCDEALERAGPDALRQAHAVMRASIVPGFHSGSR